MALFKIRCCLLLLIVLSSLVTTGKSWWRRRRRGCSAVNCLVGNWNSWEFVLQHVGRLEYRHDTGARPEQRVVEDRAPPLCQTLGAAMDRVAKKSEYKYARRRRTLLTCQEITARSFIIYCTCSNYYIFCFTVSRN